MTNEEILTEQLAAANQTAARWEGVAWSVLSSARYEEIKARIAEPPIAAPEIALESSQGVKRYVGQG